MTNVMAAHSKPTRKERERARHRSEIIDAAERVFAEKGYERARMSDIADEAEFSVGFLYQTWENKEDLYVSMLESKMIEFKKHVQERIKGGITPLEQIGLLIESSVDFVDEHKGFARLILASDSPTLDNVWGPVRNRIKKLNDAHHQFFEKVFAEGIKDGTFVDVPPRDLALALDGVIFAFAKDHLRNTPDKSFVQRGDVIKKVFLQSVLKKRPKKGSARS
jgi:AcrR family transcriptional regulator